MGHWGDVSQGLKTWHPVPPLLLGAFMAGESIPVLFYPRTYNFSRFGIGGVQDR